MRFELLASFLFSFVSLQRWCCVAGDAAEGDDARFAPLGPPAEWFASTRGPPYNLAVRRWVPPGTAPARAARVVFQHGGGWHAGYHDAPFRALAAAGYEVSAVEAQGHGFSDGPGGRTRWDSLASVREDLRRFCLAERARQPDAAVVLLAESMGAVVGVPLALGEADAASTTNRAAADSAAESPPAVVDALVVAGGLFRMHPATAPPGVVTAVLRLLGRFFGARRVTLPSLNATFDDAFGDARWASAARQDPNIVVSAFYLGAMAQVLGEMPALRAGASRLAAPLLVMHSEVDTRTDVAAATAFYDDAAATDKTLLLYPDAAHQLFQDSDANTRRATADLLAWLDARFPAAASKTQGDTCAEEDGVRACG